MLQAFAEQLHERVRKTLWGYSGDEALNASDLHKIQYAVRLLEPAHQCHLFDTIISFYRPTLGIVFD